MKTDANMAWTRNNTDSQNRKINIKNAIYGWVPVAHTCNSSYMGGWYIEDWGLRPAQGNSS
jgi:hypothetical protein